MELHKAIKEIVTSKGAEMINNIQIINFLLDYQAFKEKPATKLILRDVINAGYGESILTLQNDPGWPIKLKQYQHEFIDSCGYKEELAVYVFESLAYALGMIKNNNELCTKKHNTVNNVNKVDEDKTCKNTIPKNASHLIDETKRWALRLIGLSEVKTTFFEGASCEAISELQHLGIIGSTIIRNNGSVQFKVHPVIINDINGLRQVLGNLTENIEESKQKKQQRESTSIIEKSLAIENLKKMVLWNPMYKPWILNLADTTIVSKSYFIKNSIFNSTLVNYLQKAGILSAESYVDNDRSRSVGYWVLINDKSELEKIIES